MDNKKKIFLASGVFLLVLFALATFVYNSAKREGMAALAKENLKVFVPDYAVRIGDKNAKVLITEFLDPECEACRALAPEVKSILKDYHGKVQLVVRYAAFHKNSKIAIKALEAARLQGKFEESLDTLFRHQPTWGNHHNPQPELIFDYLLQLGLDMEQLRLDMESEQIAKIIESDARAVKDLKVRGTPTFFVNGKPLESFGISFLKDLVRNEVESAY